MVPLSPSTTGLVTAEQPLHDPLLGRHNVVHTPHDAGRTKEANLRFVEMLVEQFPEYDRERVPSRPSIP